MEKKFTSSNFESEVLKAAQPVLVDFYADWCGPCRMMAPHVAELARTQEGKLIVGKLNVDENPDLAAAYRVMSIPTLILFKNGQPAGRLVGYQEPEEILEMVARA